MMPELMHAGIDRELDAFGLGPSCLAPTPLSPRANEIIRLVLIRSTQAGGNAYQVPAGRRDGSTSRASDTSGNLPPPTANVPQLTQIFASKGLNQKDMVILSGAHTIGSSHCSSFSSRLSQSGTTAGQDPTMDPAYVAQLARQCPQGGDPLVPMDAVSPNAFDEGFFKGVMANRGLLSSDQALLGDKNTAVQVVTYANDPATFQNDFAAAMVKMGSVGVLTGSSGKIRANCRVA